VSVEGAGEGDARGVEDGGDGEAEDVKKEWAGQGNFEAVLRSRATTPRKSGALIGAVVLADITDDSGG
jgi:hypothetical protein